MGKARKKEKDSPHSAPDEQKLYLEGTMLEQRFSDMDFRQIIDLPSGLDYNEWLASHTLAFFEHVNLIYGTISEFCTMSGCPDMTGPSSRQYLWFDEKGKKCKVAAPHYIDYVMTFTQKTMNDESIFPTKYANEFPSSIESIVKKIHRLLFHVVAHMYHAHFKEIVLLSLHAHLNCVFAHLVLFNDRFHLIDEKETEVLHDLVVGLKLHAPDSAKESTGGATTSGASSGEPGERERSGMDGGSATTTEFDRGSLLVAGGSGQQDGCEKTGNTIGGPSMTSSSLLDSQQLPPPPPPSSSSSCFEELKAQ